MMLDILFIFCKIKGYPGYRQGMHELLALILWVVEQDAIQEGSDEEDKEAVVPDEVKHALDRNFIEHDAFSLFFLIMRSAISFYGLGPPGQPLETENGTVQHSSPIVERSQRIHLLYLSQADPELSKHLIDIEVLPQIFLMWVSFHKIRGGC